LTASPAIAAPPASDLAITGSAPTASTAVFRSFAYTLTVTNLGPDSTNSVRVVGTLPAGQAFGSAKPSTGACAAENVLSCDLGKLDANQSATIALIVSAQDGVRDTISGGAGFDRAHLDRMLDVRSSIAELF